MNPSLLQRSFLLAAVAVVLGAFGAHGLKGKVDAAHIEIYKTSIQYLFFHVFALIVAGMLEHSLRSKLVRLASVFFQLGILFFCGSLFYLTFYQFPIKWMGLITPLGGLFLTTGWLLLFWSFQKSNRD